MLLISKKVLEKTLNSSSCILSMTSLILIAFQYFCFADFKHKNHDARVLFL